MLAMEDSASIAWARVMRGTSSMAKKDTPASASSTVSRSDVSGSPKPIRICFGRIRRISDIPWVGLAPGARAWTIIPADSKTSAREPSRTPRRVYSSSVNPASSPAEYSRITLSLALMSLSQALGVSATRRSPANVSHGIPTVAVMNLYKNHIARPSLSCTTQ